MVGRCSTCQSRSLRSDNAHVAVPKHARPHGEQTPRAHAPHSHSSSLRLDLPGASMPAAAERIRRARFARGRLPMARGSSPPSRSKCKDAPMLSASFRSQAERGRMQRGILKGGTCRVVGHSTEVVAADVPSRREAGYRARCQRVLGSGPRALVRAPPSLSELLARPPPDPAHGSERHSVSNDTAGKPCAIQTWSAAVSRDGSGGRSGQAKVSVGRSTK
jgi:hypothetical protein